MIIPSVLLVLALTHSIQGECDGNCKVSPLMYEVLKCKPIYENPGDCCPKKYDCSNMKDYPENKCVFKGKFYKAGEEIPSSETYSNCRIGCRCIEGPSIMCAILDCPEYLGLRPPPGCQLKYELGKCCSAGQICAPFDSVAKCKVGEKEYVEGERFTPPDVQHTSCVCKEGFKGEFVEPFCQRNTCGFEIGHAGEVKNKCAAVFWHNDGCPTEFLCPSSDDNILKAATTKDASSDLQCQYGDQMLNIGDTFMKEKIMSDYEKMETKCECAVPPFVTCTKKQIFDIEKTPLHIRPYVQ